MTKYRVDSNCDMGESFGKYKLGHDERIIEYISSANNITCGFHTGDSIIMAKTVEMAARRGVNIGAYLGYPDLQRFGRRFMDLSPEEIRDFVIY